MNFVYAHDLSQFLIGGPSGAVKTNKIRKQKKQKNNRSSLLQGTDREDQAAKENLMSQILKQIQDLAKIKEVRSSAIFFQPITPLKTQSFLSPR